MEHARQWNQMLFHDAPDARLKDWPLMGNPVQVTVIAVTWLWFVLRAGPRYMSDRKPYKLAGLIQAINVVQILANAFVAYEFLVTGWLNGYSLGCQPCDHSFSPSAVRMARACYFYFTLKLLDLVDTVIYVLRRKPNQITFLHLYHHVATLSLAWLVTNYVPGGQPTLTSLLNAIVHVIMYTYYFLAALGPEYQKYLWWKKYLTRIQLTQFVMQFAHGVNGLIRTDCDFPRPLIYIFLPIIVIMFALFLDFYSRAYRQKSTLSTKEHQH